MELAESGPTAKSKISARADIEVRKITAVFDVTQVGGRTMNRWCDFAETVTVCDVLDDGACPEGVLKWVEKNRLISGLATEFADEEYIQKAAHGYGSGSGDGYGDGYGGMEGETS